MGRFRRPKGFGAPWVAPGCRRAIKSGFAKRLLRAREQLKEIGPPERCLRPLGAPLIAISVRQRAAVVLTRGLVRRSWRRQPYHQAVAFSDLGQPIADQQNGVFHSRSVVRAFDDFWRRLDVADVGDVDDAIPRHGDPPNESGPPWAEVNLPRRPSPRLTGGLRRGCTITTRERQVIQKRGRPRTC